MPYKRIPELEENINAILDLMEDGIFLTNRQGITLRVNKAYEAISGVERKHLEGVHVLDLQQRGIFNKVLNPSIVQTGKPCSTVQEFGKDRRTIHLRGFPVFDDNGQVCMVVTFARDITTITQLQQQINEQGKLIEQYHDRMAAMLDSHRQIGGVFASPAMQSLLDTLMRIAATDATVLLLGETGTGKDVLARTIHANSPRNNEVFIKVDCGSISESLIESELFGYVKGAFTGATSQGKAGYFETADGGTLFLDEIGELPFPLQSRLLRVLQDQEIVRVGSSKAKKVNVRIIAATNRDLSADIEAGKFRQDLYFRLGVAEMNVPPLRERIEDIPLLAQLFLGQFNAKYKKHIRFSSKVLKALSQYSWPGNVRELQNMIQHLVITHDNEMLDLALLPGRVREGLSAREKSPMPSHSPQLPQTTKPLKEVMAEIEYTLLMQAVQHYGSYSKTAEMFQINRSTLFRKLQRQQAGKDGNGPLCP